MEQQSQEREQPSRWDRLTSYIERELGSVLGGDAYTVALGHLKGVALVSKCIGKKRGLDGDLCYGAGLLHDYYADMTGDREGHGPKGAIVARRVLAELGDYSREEMFVMCKAIDRHSDKAVVDGPYDEVLKDADVVLHHLHGAIAEDDIYDLQRRDALWREEALWRDGEFPDLLKELSPVQEKKRLAFILDIDDTLYDQVKPMVKACEEATGKKVEDPEQFFTLFLKHSNEVFYPVERGELTLEESRILRFMRTMEDLGTQVDREKAKRFQELYLRNQGELSLSLCLREMLDLCAEAGVFLCVLTNGPQKHQMNKFLALGLDTWIPREQVLISESIGYAKPSQQAYQYCIKRFSLTPSSTYMVGDSYKNDIAPALACQLHAIWFNRHRAELSQEDKKPDKTVYSEEALFGAIRDVIGQYRKV